MSWVFFFFNIEAIYFFHFPLWDIKVFYNQAPGNCSIFYLSSLLEYCCIHTFIISTEEPEDYWPIHTVNKIYRVLKNSLKFKGYYLPTKMSGLVAVKCLLYQVAKCRFQIQPWAFQVHETTDFKKIHCAGGWGGRWYLYKISRGYDSCIT